MKIQIAECGPITRSRMGLQQHRSDSRSPKGQSLVEFSLCLIILLMFVFGIIDLGRGIFAYNTIAHSAREGTRYAIVHGSHSVSPVNPANAAPLINYVSSYTTGLQPSLLTVQPQWSNNSNDPGSIVTITVSYSFQPVTAFFKPLLLRSQSSCSILN